MATATQSFSYTSQISGSWSGGFSPNLVLTGFGQCNVRISVSWDDNPNEFGDAMGTVSVGGGSTGTPGNDGSSNFNAGTFAVNGSLSIPTSFGNINAPQIQGNTLRFLDNDGNDANGTVSFSLSNFRTFNWSQTASINFNPGGNINGVSGDGGCTTALWSGATNQGVVRIRSGGVDRASGVQSGSGSYTTCAGQSNAQGVTPRTQQRCCTVIRSAFGQDWTVQACESYSYRNDTDPTPLSVPNQAQIASGPLAGQISSLLELEPNQTYQMNVGSAAGIDAPTGFRSDSGGLSISRGSGFTTGNLTVTNGNPLRVRWNTGGFNTDKTVSGFNGDGAPVGQYNPPTGTNSHTFSIGSGTANDVYTFQYRVRRPVIGEVIDLELSTTVFPNPDIDTVTPNPNTTTFIETGPANALPLDDIEIPVDVKADDPDVQIRINGSGSWLDVQEI